MICTDKPQLVELGILNLWLRVQVPLGAPCGGSLHVKRLPVKRQKMGVKSSRRAKCSRYQPKGRGISRFESYREPQGRVAQLAEHLKGNRVKRLEVQILPRPPLPRYQPKGGVPVGSSPAGGANFRSGSSMVEHSERDYPLRGWRFESFPDHHLEGG